MLSTCLNMSFYYFELVNGQMNADVGGYDCADINEAKDIAKGLAIKLASKQPQMIGKGVAVSVRAHDDHEVYRVELDAANRLLAH
jgi:hypothetical protein